MKRLVVNADDFGLTENTNQGIAEAHRRGILTSATLMANGVAFDSAVEVARSSPELGVGVHLNLTHGRPVSGPSLVPSLVKLNGHFSGAPAKLARGIPTRSVCLAEVERELAAQIEKVQASGIAATHLDGHKHVHMLPGVFPIVVRLAQQYRISGVRLAIERTTGLGRMLRSHAAAAGTILMQYLRGHALALLAPHCRELLRQAQLASSMYFFGITQTGFLDEEVLDTLLWNLPEGTSELMCHPGYADDALPQTETRLVQQRERELQALTRPETRKLVAALGIELVNYRGLIQG